MQKALKNKLKKISTCPQPRPSRTLNHAFGSRHKAKIEDRNDLITGFPGESLVPQGIEDAYLVSIASPRLNRAGLLSGTEPELQPEPELCLYRLLRARGGDAYSKYNALVGELVSFENALDRRMRENSILHGSIQS